jgi:hypothetical protein
VRPTRRLLPLTMATICALAALATSAVPAVAAGHVYVVTSVGDKRDRFVGDGVCDTTPSSSTTDCTLRAAIAEANADAAPDVIRFAISAGSNKVKTIAPHSGLPIISEPLTIDGYTQPGAVTNSVAPGTNAKLRIVLDGVDAHGVPGLQAQARVTIRGLVICRFGRGIQLSEGADGSTIMGDFIGTDVNGKLDRGNASSGILVNAANVRIGSVARVDRNLISGNGGAGVDLGIAAKDALVQNDLIGTSRGGVNGLGNDGDGVFVTGSAGHIIGGEFSGQGNVIGFNGGAGVSLLTVSSTSLGTLVPTKVQVLANSITHNAGIGIDLGADGVSPNDPAPDADKGPNHLQNFPRIDSAVAAGGDTVIKGRLTSRRSVGYEVQLFQSSAGDPEGRAYLGSATVTTGADGKGSFTFHAGAALFGGTLITATATDKVRRDTSEFSPPKTVTSH